jgi:hypothetical protein
LLRGRSEKNIRYRISDMVGLKKPSRWNEEVRICLGIATPWRAWQSELIRMSALVIAKRMIK